MTDHQSERFFDRAIGNLAVAWRDIAASAARGVGIKLEDEATRDAGSLRTMMQACLDAKGGEVSARARAAELGRAYLKLDSQGRRLFLGLLAKDFGVDREKAHEAIDRYEGADEEAEILLAEQNLRQVLVPRRVKLLTQFNSLPEGVKFLVDMRAELMEVMGEEPAMAALDRDFLELLTSWFDTGFLDLQRITWDSPAALLEKLIAYEAVHEIRSWDDLRNRLASDRRCFALFHPRMPHEPLAFVEVALVKGIARNVQTLLDEKAPQVDPRAADTAIFYSISNTQRGLKGISFGDYLIKMVVLELLRDLPQLKVFATLSPVPGLRRWIERLTPEAFDRALSDDDRGALDRVGAGEDRKARLLGKLDTAVWHEDEPTAKALEPILMRLAATYLTGTHNGQAQDPVERFHLRNGARLDHINWLADTSGKGLKQSAGIMVNYRYIVDDIEKNHEAYVTNGRIAVGGEVKALAKKARENGRSGFRRLGLG
jgi:malonyl-CoA decarboxylase